MRQLEYPIISVIVPVYNVEKYIHLCVDSIISQSFADFELILVDDGSPDRCPEICDAYAAADSRVRVIHQTNQGQAAARNHGIRASKGEWICFVDSDDLIHPQMLEHLYQAAISESADISMCDAVESESVLDDFFYSREMDSQRIRISETSLEELYHHGEHRYWVIWGKLIRKSILEKIPFTEGRIYEDNAVVCRWLYEAQVVANTQQRYYFYRVNQGSTTKSTFNLTKLDFLWALDEQLLFYKTVHYTTKEKNIAAYYLNTAAWYSSRVRNELNNIWEAAKIRKRMRQLIREYPLDSLPLTEAEKLEICRAFHPVISQLGRIPRVACEVLSSGGINGLINRILRKFRKYE